MSLENSASRGLLILAAHEPVLDPRIEWICDYSPSQFQLYLLGFKDPRRSSLCTDTPRLHQFRVERETEKLIDSARYLFKEFKGTGGLRLSWKLKFLVVFGLLLQLPLILIWKLLKLPQVAARVLDQGVKKRGASARRNFPGISESRISLSTVRVYEFAQSGILKAYVAAKSRGSRVLAKLGRGNQFLHELVYFVKTNAALARAAGQFSSVDIIHANDFDTLIAAVLIKRRTSAKLVYDAHEFWPHADVRASWWKILFWTEMERALITEVDCAATVSAPLAERMSKEYGVPFICVPNCEPWLNSAKERPKNPSKKPIKFVFQGLFAPERGVEELITAWQTIDSSQAILLLRGPDNQYKEQCLHLAEKLGVLGGSVLFPPAVTETELVDTAAEADVGLIPYNPVGLNHMYCCPNKLSQYMQAGLALMVNNLPYVKNIVQKYDCGLTYDSADASNIAACVQRFVADPGLLERFKKNSREGAKSEFHWQNQSRPLYDAYIELSTDLSAAPAGLKA